MVTEINEKDISIILDSEGEVQSVFIWSQALNTEFNITSQCRNHPKVLEIVSKNLDEKEERVRSESKSWALDAFKDSMRKTLGV